MSRHLIIPIKDLFSDTLSENQIVPITEPDGKDALDYIFYDPSLSRLEWDSMGLCSVLRIIVAKRIKFDLSFVDGASIGIGPSSDSFLEFNLSIKSSPFKFAIDHISITIHFPPNIIQAYKRGASSDEAWEVHETIEGYDFVLENIGISINGDRDIDFSNPSLADLSPAMIGNTGFIIDLDSLQIITGTIPTNLYDIIFPGFKGLYISGVSVYYHKPDSGTRIPGIHLEHAAIGSGGFTGKGIVGSKEENPDISSERLNAEDFEVSELSDKYLIDFQLGGMDIILWHFSATFEKSIPKSGTLTGLFKTGLSERWFKFKASLGGPDGDFMLEVGGAADTPLISLEHDYFEIKADSIAYKLDDGIHYAIISGSIKPKIEGFDWPEMKIEGLSISSEGDISIPGGWIKAPNTITLNFGAFKIGINEIGFGNEGEEPEPIHQWLGFSGEMNLVEGLDLKASVEGLKFSWLKNPIDGDRNLITTLKGIAVEFEIPNTLSFKGSVKYEELTAENNGGTGLTGKLFRGNIDLNLMSVRLQIEAELIIGKLKDADGNEFTTFFIVMGAQLPAGIPMGATGTSLYGLKGLGAFNSGPTKTEEQNWYEWYKAEPEREITSMQKWMPVYDNYAFGAGVTIGTMFDDGFTLNMSVMLVILLPGPVIVLEGKANLLKQRTEGQQEAGGPEGAFYLLAVLDGRAGTFMLNVDVKYSLEDVITIGASLEAFFDFNNSSNWYLYIGRKEPDTKRIRAEILSLFQANAYFMIDNTSLQTGASVGFDFRKKYGPVSIVLIAKIGFDAAIFWKPMQLQGALELEASLGIKVFGIGLELYLYMLLEGRVPKPYWIHGVAEVGIKLFWPLPDLSVRVELEWSQPAETPAAWPLLKECSFSHHKGSGTTWKIEIGDSDVPAWQDFPIVPVDARPVLTFARPLNNLREHEGSTGTVPIFKTPFDQIGDQKFTYKLDQDNMALEVFDGTGWVAKRTGINTSGDEDFVIERDSIINVQDDLDPNEPQIQLWKYSARDHVNDYGREDYNQNHPACNPTLWPKYITINWQGVPDNTKYDFGFSYAGLNFVASQDERSTNPFVDRYLLHTRDLTINFPEPVYQIAIRFAKTDFSDNSLSALQRLNTSVSFNGRKIGGLVNQNYTLYYSGFLPFNSVSIQGIRLSIIDIKYMTQKSAVDQLIGTNDPSPSAERQSINGPLFLEPAKFYRLKVNTSVDRNDLIDVHTAENYIYFRTDEGPGITEVSENPLGIDTSVTISKRTLTHKEKAINILSTYIERTLPIDGALNHYLDYDVGVQFNEAYVEDLFSESIRMRFRDRNGKLLDEPTGSFMLGFLPLFHPGLLSWLQDKEEGACGSDVVSTTPAPYLNFALSLPFKKHSLYKAEMIINTDLGEQNLHQFQFTTSRYKTFKEHVLGAYEDGNIKAIGLPEVEMSTLFDARNIYNSEENYKDEVARFNSIEDDLLVKHRSFKLCKEYHTKLNQRSIADFEILDNLMNESLRLIEMNNRPSATKFEIFKIPVATNGDCLLIVESPEPIDWIRLTCKAKEERGSNFNLSFIWNNDKTRAFLYRQTGVVSKRVIFKDVPYNFNITFSGNPDPITGVVLKNGDIVEENVSFDLIKDNE